MELKIAAFWLAVYAALWFLRRSPTSTAARAAFSWVGPLPNVGEPWSSFQLRWAVYAFWWFCQIAIAFFVLAYLPKVWPSAKNETWFLVGAFALGLGGMLAATAAVGFLFKSLKARMLGPNPSFQPEPPQHAV